MEKMAERPIKQEISFNAWRLKVKDFIKLVADEEITENTQIKFGAGYYTFYIDDFKFVNNQNGTGLIISKILDEDIIMFKNEEE